jgi:arsenite methyltransferase
MENAEEVKKVVREKYGEIALQSTEQNQTSCCGVGGSCGDTYTIFSEDYSAMKGYNADADLGLGCGLPTEYAKMKEGDTVVDLGSGAGNDCFVARSIVGEKGAVIGIDMTEAMIDKARENARKLGYKNVTFRLGEIEDIPMAAKHADVVVSNCVLNLVPSKAKAFEEIFRILKHGGHFSISDVVLKGDLPKGIKAASEMYAGCVAGALQIEEYLNLAYQAGFKNVQVQKEREINIPDEILLGYINADELREYRQSGKGIYSITVYAEKPQVDSCCGPNCCG